MSYGFWSLKYLLLFMIAIGSMTNSRKEHTDCYCQAVLQHWLTSGQPHNNKAAQPLRAKEDDSPGEKLGFPVLTSRGYSKCQGYERKGRHSRKLTRSVWAGSGICSLPESGPSHTQVFEVCYLDSELSHAWQEGEGGCVVWQRAEQGAEGWSLDLRLAHTTSHARHFTIQSSWKMRKRPKLGFH